MAVMPKSDHDRLPQRSILDLEKGNEAFPAQLAEACNILRIELQKPSKYLLSKDTAQQKLRGSGPREEWALRWLLKKLQSTDSQLASPCQNFEAWLLLRELIARNTSRNTARLLDVHKITETLQRTFKWLRKKSDCIFESSQSLSSSSEDGPEIADSSSATIEASPIEEPKKSRKRKRDTVSVRLINRIPCCTVELEFLYTSIYSVIGYLQRLAEDSHEGSHEYMVELLKSVLKSSTEQAADILGSSIEVANYYIEASYDESKSWTDTTEHITSIHEICISSAIKIWNSHLTTADDPRQHYSHKLFSAQCLMPILKLLCRCRARFSAIQNQSTVDILEELLLNHIIFPTRASFLKSKSWRKEPTEFSSSLSMENLMSPLLEALDPHRSFHNKADPEISPIPMLFSVAVRSLPRDSPKQRSVEDSWLRHLFGYLTSCASTFAPSSTEAQQSGQYITTLNLMLRVALDNKVHLDGAVIESNMAHVLEISEVVLNSPCKPMFWTFIGLCLEADPRILTTSSQDILSGHVNSKRTPNKFLQSLLSKVTFSGRKLSSDSESYYTTKLNKIVLPLAEAFAKARNLTSFVYHWQDQLANYQLEGPHLQVATSSTFRVRCIWEDEMILQAVGRLIDSTLTAGQIDSLLQNSYTNLASLSFANSDGCSRFLANIIIVDCIVGSIWRESVWTQLAETACTIYWEIWPLVLNLPAGQEPQVWRLWRILATLKEHCPLVKSSLVEQQVEHQLMAKAAKYFTRLVFKSKTAGQDYADELHAFSFMLRTASAQGREGEISDLIINSITIAVEALLEYSRANSDDMNRSVPTGFTKHWNGRNDTLSSVKSLLLGCIGHLIKFPTIIRYWTADLQSRFFEQLFSIAVKFERTEVTAVSSLNGLSLWYELLESDLLREDRSVARQFRDYQVSSFLELIEAQDLLSNIDEISKYRLAFESIQRTPVHTFRRWQRRKILDGVLRVVTGKKLRNGTMIVDHITLLIQYTTISKDPSELLNARHEESQEEALKGCPSDKIPLLNLVHKLDIDKDPITSMSALVAIRTLTDITLRNCISASKEKTSQYLVPFYGRLGKLHAAILEPQSHPAVSSLLDTSLTFYFHHVSELPEMIKMDWASLRQEHLQVLCQLLNKICENISIIQELGGRSQLSLVLEGIASYFDILNAHFYPVSSQLSDVADTLHKAIVSESSQNFLNESATLEHLLVQVVRIQLLLGVANQNLHSAVPHLLRGLQAVKSSSGGRKLMRYYQHAIRAIELDDRIKLLKTFALTDGGEHLDPDCLCLLQTVILAEDAVAPLPEPYGEGLAWVFTTLCNGLLEPADFPVHILTIRCMNLLLQKQPRIITQWHIENTLSAIAIASALQTSCIANKSTSMVFLCLCRLFSTILVVHRTKLGGRYHLVIPVLQGLLRNLYIPYSETSKTAITDEQGFLRGQAQAKAYARLLITLCDPTVSAVTRSKNASQRRLTDLTKKARNIAGQHLQYIIMEYCCCQLNGRLNLETKAALIPGLYAVLDVLPQEVMRTMNAAMDSSSRSIFKALYEDHRRRGQWQGT